MKYFSQTNSNMDFLEPNSAFKFVDDDCFVEVFNLAVAGLACFNALQQVPSDMATGELFLPPENILTQQHLDRLTTWADSRQMTVNGQKTKYML